MLGLPVFISLFAVWGNRRPDRSRMLTFAMLGMAGAVIVTGSIAQGIAFLFYPALIALAVAGFRVRRADLPARMAERATPGGARGGRGRDGAIDVESAEGGGEAEPGRDEVEYDPLAELEAEIEAEKGAGPADAGDEAGGDAGDAGGRGRRGRARRSG